MFTRRELLKRAAAAGAGAMLAPFGRTADAENEDGILVNDVQSQLNSTRVRRVLKANSLDQLQSAIGAAASKGQAISIAGGRHAMGGQQFAADSVLLDMTAMNRVVALDASSGVVEAEAGIQWPELIRHLVKAQAGIDRQWGILQKQTGADTLTLGGSVAANIHGRGLRLKPLIGEVESFVLVDAGGRAVSCSRRENSELFQLAVGGSGLFGVIGSLRLRLGPRRKLERSVELVEAENLMPAFEKKIAAGCLYGDFQFVIDESSADFLRRGILSCYRPVAEKTPVPLEQKRLSAEDWEKLTYLAHVDRKKASELYIRHYLSTSGQIYWSDTHQLSTYVPDYHSLLDRKLGAAEKATEVITEIYVPREALPRFLEDARRDLIQCEAALIYGTIRLIERDDESFLAWAGKPYACVIFNLHTVHSEESLKRAKATFRRLIDLGIRHGGSYYLTYHRWAERRQVEACYPKFVEFLRIKRKHDPGELFQSEWYRHYRNLFADKI